MHGDRLADVVDGDAALIAEFAPGRRRRLLAPLARVAARRFVRRGQHMRVSQFQALGVPPGHVVLLGDSITEYGLWNEWFVGRPVLNRGVGGETAGDLLRRLDSALCEPRGVLLLIGTNDLTLGISLRAIVEDVRALLDDIERRCPGTPVLVQSVMPRTPAYRDDVHRLNRAYEALVNTRPRHVEYVDLWPALADADGDLRRELSGDGLHLNGAGYAAWVEVLGPHIEHLFEA